MSMTTLGKQQSASPRGGVRVDDDARETAVDVGMMRTMPTSLEAQSRIRADYDAGQSPPLTTRRAPITYA